MMASGCFRAALLAALIAAATCAFCPPPAVRRAPVAMRVPVAIRCSTADGPEDSEQPPDEDKGPAGDDKSSAFVRTMLLQRSVQTQ